MTTAQVALSETVDRLARLEPSAFPLISLYLNLQADQHGKDNYATFVKKELFGRARTYPPRSAERESFDRDTRRIETFLENEVAPAANGLALFACSGQNDFFEALPLDAPVRSHRLTVSDRPHLYPLALLLDEYPPHAVVLADSHAARVFVFALGRTVREQVVTGQKINRSAMGGWAQMRYQRHVEKLQADHARELVRTLERAVRDEQVEHVVLAGDEVNIPLIKKELSPELSGKVVDILKLDARTPEHAVMRAAAEALRRHDAKSDAELVDRVLGDYRAGGLAVAGADETRKALDNGQVDEVYLSAAGTLRTDDASITADGLVARARRTSARVRFIEDASLLADVGGVAAVLRYRSSR